MVSILKELEEKRFPVDNEPEFYMRKDFLTTKKGDNYVTVKKQKTGWLLEIIEFINDNIGRRKTWEGNMKHLAKIIRNYNFV